MSEKDPIECVSDGFMHFEMHTGDAIHLKKSPQTFKLINLNRIDYFTTIRRKLGWSGKLR